MKMLESEFKRILEWYQENQEIYKRFTKEIVEIIKNELKDNDIFYNTISSRTKEFDSFKEKCKKEKYRDPINEIFDLSGIRITAYTNSDVRSISKIIENTFEVDEINSVNKMDSIGVDQFGYLSVHYVASLPDEYIEMNRCEEFKGHKFEIQIRTLLQHAWSEIEHDRNYKLKNALPKELERRFYMIAGVLEMVDREFDALTSDISEFVDNASTSIKSGQFDMELNAISLKAFLRIELEGIKIKMSVNEEEIDELKKYGIKTLSELKNLMDNLGEDKIQNILSLNPQNSLSSVDLIRDFMIINDKEKYFSIWDNNWFIDEEEIVYFKKIGVDVSDYQNEDD